MIAAPPIAAVPAGAWAVGVSGGADSVALLLRLAARADPRGDRTWPQREGEAPSEPRLRAPGDPGSHGGSRSPVPSPVVDLRLHVVHLDHETRGAQSTADAEFVRELCAGANLACTVARLSEVEAATSPVPPPANPSARFRAARFALFRHVCAGHALHGVILAHHADDQAETIFQRLLKGSAPAGLTGMRADSVVGGLRVLRPLLGVPSADLRNWLSGRGQPWREDSSNRSLAYQRNRVRGMLRRDGSLARALCEAGNAMRGLVTWARENAPTLAESFAARDLADLPDVLAAESARRWLVDRGAAVDELTPAVIGRLVEMARDAAGPPRVQVPGKVTVARRGGMIRALGGGLTSSSGGT